MRVLIDVTHPAHVHFFRCAIDELGRLGHEVVVTARDKDITLALLKEMEIEHHVLGAAGRGITGLAGELLRRDWALWRFARRHRPDVLTGVGGVWAAHVAALLRRPAVVWDDTEHARVSHALTFPFASSICTPECYTRALGAKQVRYAGCHELAYLHPDRFTPDPALVAELGIDPDRPYAVIRLVGWGAHHDVGHHGFDRDGLVRFVQELSEHVQPCVTVEGELPAELERYRLAIPFRQIHHVLAFASLYVGEGATMASEAAVLGTPSVYVNTLGAGTIDMFVEAGMMTWSIDADEVVRTCLEIATHPGESRSAAVNRRDAWLAEQTDVAGFVVEKLLEKGGGANPCGS
jgi:predicted glycosyltransferase